MQVRAFVVLVGVVACGDNSLPSTRIVGQVWDDTNGDGVRDPDEPALAGVAVFVDLDGNENIGGTEPRTRSAADGSYELIVSGGGTYDVRVTAPFGRRFPSPSNKRRGIIGGGDTVPGQYGFMVQLAQRFDETDDFVFPFCGGVLVTDRHVVTAAHCSVGVTPREVAIVGGAYEQFGDGLILDVGAITTHPSFTFDPANGNDVAVWTLAEPVDLEADGLNTVEMLAGGDEHDATLALEAPGTLSTTIGWGASDRSSTLLQQVHIPLVSSEDCAKAYPDSTQFETQICAGAPEGGIDTCQGDSGGPLLVRDVERQVWVHAGITSYGDGCGLPGSPGVYARVSALAAWVMEHATEPGGGVKVTVTTAETATLDFPMVPSTRPQVGPIAPRWQATGTTLPDTVGANVPVTVRWAIYSDDPTLTGFTCRFVPDATTPAIGQDVTCGLGTTEVSLAGFSTGIFATELVVARDADSFARHQNVIAGAPARTTTTGALEVQDPFDPDYAGAAYHIDYYDVSGLTGTKAFAIEAETSSFSMFLALYDADERDFDTGGGILQFGSTTLDGRERIVVVPEPGRNYLIGISSNDLDAVGAYTVSILNDGAIVPH